MVPIPLLLLAVRLTGVPLDGLAAGDYTLVLTFEDRVAHLRRERRERFAIEPFKEP